MKKIMLVFGTRPEAIKMCPLIKALKEKENIQTIVVATGQHREMLDMVFSAFDIVPDVDLNIMQQSQTLTDVTVKILEGLGKILDYMKPDIVLVHGDTTTSFAAGLACFYRQIKIGHVEAGLRTYDLKAPYPEEFNRQAVDIFSDYYFAPTERAKDNLLREGKNPDNIYVTGNTGIDALRTTVRADYTDETLEHFIEQKDKLILLTAHRRENLGEPMRRIFRAVKAIVEKYPDVKVIYPVHKNPAVVTIARTELGDCENILLINPLDVIDFHNYMSKAFLILTDSGGIQEEAPSLGKPVLVLRDTTERPEGVETGTLKIVGTDEKTIFDNICDLLDNRESYDKMSKASNPYGDGYASERIAEILDEE